MDLEIALAASLALGAQFGSVSKYLAFFTTSVAYKYEKFEKKQFFQKWGPKN